MAELFSFDAVLLAGGQSTRFGSDKAFLDWRGQPLYERQLQTLRSLQPDHLWLSANASQQFPGDLPDVTTVIDEKSNLGPLGGLLTVFRASEAEWILVLGVDLPLMESEFLSRLIEAGGGVVSQSDRFWEPLVGLYPRSSMLPLFESAAATGDLKLQGIVEQAKDSGFIESFPLGEEDALYFTNLNSTRELDAIRPGRADEEIEIQKYRQGEALRPEPDYVAAEEPLELRVNGISVSVMMRTPGQDEELATGFLYTEGIIESASEIREINHCPDLDPESRGNSIEVCLDTDPDLTELTRHVFTSSSCGVCGKATIDSVFQQFPPIESGEAFSGDVLLRLPDRLREAQATFERTGGIHASALFSRSGELLLLREDVGRHNALDKVIGSGLREEIDFRNVILLVSGRISFELMQKALSVGIPLVAGISAPSSLAVSLAKESGQTLVGFLRGRGFNVYAGSLSGAKGS